MFPPCAPMPPIPPVAAEQSSAIRVTVQEMEKLVNSVPPGPWYRFSPPDYNHLVCTVPVNGRSQVFDDKPDRNHGPVVNYLRGNVCSIFVPVDVGYIISDPELDCGPVVRRSLPFSCLLILFAIFLLPGGKKPFQVFRQFCWSGRCFGSFTRLPVYFS